jgi:hypothetical protein
VLIIFPSLTNNSHSLFRFFFFPLLQKKPTACFVVWEKKKAVKEK